MGEKLTRIQYIFLVILLVFSFVYTFRRHLDYPFPYHHDEWQHLGISMQMMDGGYNNQINPWLGVPMDHFDLEIGFHSFLAGLFLLTGYDPVLNYQYLAGAFAVFSSLALFLFMQKFLKKFMLSVLAIILYMSLTTNVNILGKEFFVPLTMAFPFIFYAMFLLLKIRSGSNVSSSYQLFIILIFLFMIHVPSAIILIVPLMFEPLVYKNILSRDKMVFLFPLVFLGIVVSYHFLWKGSLIDSFEYLKQLVVFEKGWGKLEIDYFLPYLYGIINAALFIVGAVFLLMNERWSDYPKSIFSFAFISLFLASFHGLTGYAILIPYSRAVHYALISMIPMTMLGFDYLLQRFSLKRNALVIVSIIYVASMFAFPYQLDKRYEEYSEKVIDLKSYAALKWIESEYGRGNKLLTPYFMTSAVYPISSSGVISLIPAQLEGGFIDENFRFFSYSCKEKEDIIRQAKASLVLSPGKLTCSFLQEVYEDGYFVYTVI
ncbi:MAG: hypothetical protein NDI94_05170 [Candidatus Woesearchaeota archaeon]|nr:hypothetical protein [Candidatus Woesearchaeota archaeon]